METTAPDQPWLKLKSWKTNRILPSEKAKIFGGFLVAGFLVFINLLILISKGITLFYSPLMLLPMLTIALTISMMGHWKRWSDYGPIKLVLDPFPGVVGGHVGRTLNIYYLDLLRRSS